MRIKLLLLFFLFTAFHCMKLTAQENIWAKTSCTKRVWMTAFPAEGKRNATAVVVCPGGSYFWHDMNTEGTEVARWLQRQGFAAFVLRYRTAYVPAFITHFRYLFRGNRYPDAQNDLRQAIRYIKANARRYGIDVTHIGAMGFSAGGHLVMSGAEFFDKTDRPAFIAAIYPVVTMTAPCVHKRSRRALLGESRKQNKALRDSLSLEKHVPANCPPVFLVNCTDDPIVDYRNSILLDSALTANRIPHKYIRYQTGGHGFGASAVKGTAECRTWRKEFVDWVKRYIAKE